MKQLTLILVLMLPIFSWAANIENIRIWPAPELGSGPGSAKSSMSTGSRRARPQEGRRRASRRVFWTGAGAKLRASRQ